MATLATTMNVVINLNTINFVVDQPEKTQQIPSPKRSADQRPTTSDTTTPTKLAGKPISMYEGRVTSVSFSDTKINEVLGWMLVIFALMGALLFIFSVVSSEGISAGITVPCTFVVSFFMTYTNWLSMKFFVNS